MPALLGHQHRGRGTGWGKGKEDSAQLCLELNTRCCGGRLPRGGSFKALVKTEKCGEGVTQLPGWLGPEACGHTPPGGSHPQARTPKSERGFLLGQQAGHRQCLCSAWSLLWSPHFPCGGSVIPPGRCSQFLTTGRPSTAQHCPALPSTAVMAVALSGRSRARFTHPARTILTAKQEDSQ